MESIFRWSSSRPAAALASAFLLTIALATGLCFLRIDASMEHLLSRDDPEVRYLNEVRENFGERPVMLLLVRSESLADPAILRVVRDIGVEAERVAGVERVTSLFNLRLPVASGSSIMDRIALPEIPEDASILRDRLAELGKSGIIADHFLSRDGTSLAFVVFLEREDADGGNHRRILDELERIRANAAERLTGRAEVSILGTPLIKVLAERYILQDLIVLGPVALLVIGVLIFLFFRSLAAVFLPLLTGSLSAVATLGFMGWAGFEISVFLSTIVVLLLVVGCTEDLHILSDHLENRREGMENLAAIREVGVSLGRALLMTMSTTTLSSLSIAFTDFAGLQHFAISCAFGMTVNFLITLLVVPAALALAPPRVTPLPARPRSGLVRIDAILNHLLRRRKLPSPVFLLLLLAGAGAGILRLEVNTDYLRLFSDNSEVVRSYHRFIDAFGGASYLTVTIETDVYDGIDEPVTLAKVWRFHTFLDEQCGRAFGYPDLLGEYLKARPPSDTGPGGLPTPEALRDFRKGVPREVIRPFLDYDGSRAAIRLRINAPTSSDVLAFESRILDRARVEFGEGIEVRVAGDRLVIARLCDLVTGGLFANLAILSLSVAVMISLSVRSALIGTLAILPNLFPVIVTLGAMGWLGIPMSVGTFPVTIVAFGVTVDDTIHLLARHHLERTRGGTTLDAVSCGLSRELRPVIATSVIVAAGYLVMTLSPLRVNAEVGLLFAIAMISGLLADLVMTPILLARFDRNPPADPA